MGDFKFEFNRQQTSKIPREKLFEELEKVAEIYQYKDFTQDQFSKHSVINHYTVYRDFGSWEKALLALQERLKSKGIAFVITSRRSKYSDKELFDEMERIWKFLGHRPSRDEWTSIKPNISYDALYRRFGGWTNACLKFIEYKSGGESATRVTSDTLLDNSETKPEIAHKNNKSLEISKTRTIPLNIRVKVLSRDNFRCVFCGRSPATDVGIKLHIDHIQPFSKGGSNDESNLQTLCQDCNSGKSDTLI